MTTEAKLEAILEEFRGALHVGVATGHIDAAALERRLDLILRAETTDRLVERTFDLAEAVIPGKQEFLLDPPGRRETTKADVHYHPEGEPAIDRPRGFKHQRIDAGGSGLTYYALCRARPDQRPFVVLAHRTTWDALSRLFLACNDALGTGNVPVALAWWKDVPFYQSDLAPYGSVLFATRLPLRCEGPFEWAERTWLSILTNIDGLPYYQDKAAAEGEMVP